MRSELAPELLREILRYDAETGHLFWKPRSAELFSDTPRRSRSQNAAWWNGRFANKRACKPDAHKGYLRVGIFGDEYPAHRIIWAMETGAWPASTIDHADGDKANNKFPNLREATIGENNRNRANYGKSKYRGVSWRSRQSCWIAAITTDGKVTFLGCFENEEDAARAYDSAAIVQHGEFARTNFPQSDYDSRCLIDKPEAGEVEPVGEQWRAIEDGCPATSWYPAGYGDKAGWDAIAKRHPEKYQVVTRPVYASPVSLLSAGDAGEIERLMKDLLDTLDAYRAFTDNAADAAAYDRQIEPLARRLRAALTQEPTNE